MRTVLVLLLLALAAGPVACGLHPADAVAAEAALQQAAGDCDGLRQDVVKRGPAPDGVVSPAMPVAAEPVPADVPDLRGSPAAPLVSPPLRTPLRL